MAIGKRKILLVEDERSISEPLERALDREGFDVSLAEGAAAALDAFRARPPDLVLSGVNRGRNAGEDVIYSGTVAGAVEGTILGIPSLALSQSYKSRSGRPPHWETAIRFAPDIIREDARAGLSGLTILRKRDGYRGAFAGFDPEEVARFSESDVRRRLGDVGVVEPARQDRGRHRQRPRLSPVQHE